MALSQGLEATTEPSIILLPARILHHPDNLSLLPLLSPNTIHWYMDLFSSQQTTPLSEWWFTCGSPKPLKEEWAAEPLAISDPPLPDCCGPSIGDLLYFCSASSVIFLCDVSVCSSHFFQPSRLLQLPFSSAFTQPALSRRVITWWAWARSRVLPLKSQFFLSLSCL